MTPPPPPCRFLEGEASVSQTSSDVKDILTFLDPHLNIFVIILLFLLLSSTFRTIPLSLFFFIFYSFLLVSIYHSKGSICLNLKTCIFSLDFFSFFHSSIGFPIFSSISFFLEHSCKDMPFSFFFLSFYFFLASPSSHFRIILHLLFLISSLLYSLFFLLFLLHLLIPSLLSFFFLSLSLYSPLLSLLLSFSSPLFHPSFSSRNDLFPLLPRRSGKVSFGDLFPRPLMSRLCPQCNRFQAL